MHVLSQRLLVIPRSRLVLPRSPFRCFRDVVWLFRGVIFGASEESFGDVFEASNHQPAQWVSAAIILLSTP